MTRWHFEPWGEKWATGKGMGEQKELISRENEVDVVDEIFTVDTLFAVDQLPWPFTSTAA